MKYLRPLRCSCPEHRVWLASATPSRRFRGEPASPQSEARHAGATRPGCSIGRDLANLSSSTFRNVCAGAPADRITARQCITRRRSDRWLGRRQQDTLNQTTVEARGYPCATNRPARVS